MQSAVLEVAPVSVGPAEPTVLAAAVDQVAQPQVEAVSAATVEAAAGERPVAELC